MTSESALAWPRRLCLSPAHPLTSTSHRPSQPDWPEALVFSGELGPYAGPTPLLLPQFIPMFPARTWAPLSPSAHTHASPSPAWRVPLTLPRTQAGRAFPRNARRIQEATRCPERQAVNPEWHPILRVPRPGEPAVFFPRLLEEAGASQDSEVDGRSPSQQGQTLPPPAPHTCPGRPRENAGGEEHSSQPPHHQTTVPTSVGTGLRATPYRPLWTRVCTKGAVVQRGVPFVGPSPKLTITPLIN